MPTSPELEPLLKRAEHTVLGRRPSDLHAEGGPPTGKLATAWKTVRKVADTQSAVEISHNDKLVFYDHEALLTWKVFAMAARSVFSEQKVLTALLLYACLAICSAFLVAGALPGARKLSTERFFYLSTFLKVFITFMLGIYIQRSFTRWWSNMSEFRSVLVAVKQLVYACYVMNIKETTALSVQRLCLALCYIFSAEMTHAQQMNKPRASVTAFMDDKLEWLVEHDLLTEDEQEALQGHDCSSKFGNTSLVVWSWIGESIKNLKAEMAEEGTPLLPPMFIRLMSTCQDTMTKIEQLKMNIVVQVPMLYAHLLAFLVHLNNILMAVLTGFTMGSAAAEISDRLRHLRNPDAHNGEGHLTGELYEAIQTFFVGLITVLIEPTIYLAFLQIAHNLQYPFGEDRHHLPTDFFIARLEVELATMRSGWKSSEDLRNLNTPREATADLHAESSSESGSSGVAAAEVVSATM